jgi:hypothetical protein
MTTSTLIAMLSQPEAVPARSGDRPFARFPMRASERIPWWNGRGYVECTPRASADTSGSLTIAKALIREAIERGKLRQAVTDLDEPPTKAS